MSINKPTRSNRKAAPKTNANDKIAIVLAALKAAGIDADDLVKTLTAAETPAVAKASHECAEAFGGLIWIGNKSGRVWFDKDRRPDIAELRKAFDFKPAEYKGGK